MAVLRNAKKLPKLDMNPMVDMAFLLVSFFMMTTTFKAEMPIEVRPPASRSDLKVPDKQICTISIGNNGQVFIGLDNKYDRMQMLQYAAKQENIEISQDQANRFGLLSSFGVPFSDLSNFLSLKKKERKAFAQEGIPIEDGNNQLKTWVLGARIANPRLRYVIHGDALTPVSEIKNIFDLLQDLNITRFNLVTETELNDT